MENQRPPPHFGQHCLRLAGSPALRRLRVAPHLRPHGLRPQERAHLLGRPELHLLHAQGAGPHQRLPDQLLRPDGAFELLQRRPRHVRQLRAQRRQPHPPRRRAGSHLPPGRPLELRPGWYRLAVLLLEQPHRREQLGERRHRRRDRTRLHEGRLRGRRAPGGRNARHQLLHRLLVPRAEHQRLRPQLRRGRPLAPRGLALRRGDARRPRPDGCLPHADAPRGV